MSYCGWGANFVGVATQITPGNSVYDPEDAAHFFGRSSVSSGGGFSNIFPIPGYQSEAVATYFEDHNPPYPYYYDGQYNGTNGIYNRNGRGIPDVAANGNYIATYVRGNFTLEAGTSASSPIFGALVTRINEERIEAGT